MIREGKIGSVEPVGPAVSPTQDLDVVDASGMVALPGFVDTHWHMWGALLRGVTGDGPQAGWFGRKGQLAHLLTPEDVALGVRLAAAEAIGSGITMVHDWNHYVTSAEHAEANLSVLSKSGLHGRFSWGPPTAPPQLDRDAMDRALADLGIRGDEPMDVEAVSDLAARALTLTGGRFDVGVNLRGPSRSGLEVVRAEWAEARRLGLPIAMHCAGTREEVARIRQVEVLAGEGLLGPDMVLAHCLYLTDDELRQLGNRGVSVSISPLSEARLAMGMPIVTELRDASVRVSLSLDTTAITGHVDFFELMRATLGLESIRTRDPRALSPGNVLEMAGRSGAETLDPDVVWGIEPGAQADLVLLDGTSFTLWPSDDLARAVVYGAGRGDVHTVISGGVVLKRDGKLVDVDLEALREESTEALRRLCARRHEGCGTGYDERHRLIPK